MRGALALSLALLWLTLAGPASASGGSRYVPQLDLSVLSPQKVSYHPERDDLILIVNSNGRIDVIDISIPNNPTKLSEIYAAAIDAKFRPNSGSIQIASGGQDGAVRLWNLDGTPALEPFIGHENWVHSISFSPDGDRIASGGSDGTVRLWHLDGSPSPKPFEGHEQSIDAVAFSPNGDRIASAGDYNWVRVWNLDGTPATGPLLLKNRWIRSIAFSPDGDQIALAASGRASVLRLWTLDGTTATLDFNPLHCGVLSVAFSPKGDRIFSGGHYTVPACTSPPYDYGGNHPIRFWNLDGTPATDPILGHETGYPEGFHYIGGVHSVAYAPSGNQTASVANDGVIRLWNLEGSEAAPPVAGNNLVVSSIAVSPNGQRIILGTRDSTVRPLNFDGTPSAPAFMVHNYGSVFSLGVIPAHQHLITGDHYGSLRLWPRTGTPFITTLKGQGTDLMIHRIAVSPGGRRMITIGEQGSARLWTFDDTWTHEPLRVPAKTPEKHLWFDDAAFSMGGNRVFVAEGAGKVRAWNLDGTGKASVFRAHKFSIRSIAVSPDGKRVVTGGSDGTLRIWEPDGTPIGEPQISMGEANQAGFIGDHTLWVRSMNRIWFADTDGKPRGEIRIAENGFVVLTPKGVWATNDTLYDKVRAVGPDGTLDSRDGAVPRIEEFGQARAILLANP